MNIHAYAKDQGISLKEAGRRGGKKAGRKRTKKKQLREEFEALQERNGDWWNK